MKNLIGWECAVEFNLRPSEWPIAGSPAWVIVTDVDMPMIELSTNYSGSPLWVNVMLIRTIRAVKRTQFWTLPCGCQSDPWGGRTWCSKHAPEPGPSTDAPLPQPASDQPPHSQTPANPPPSNQRPSPEPGPDTGAQAQ